MKGEFGHEKIKVYELKGNTLIKSVTLTNEWHMYSFAMTNGVRISYFKDVDGGGGVAGGVFLKDAHLYQIKFIEEPKEWKCHSVDRNEKCTRVAEGKLSWNGNYLIYPGT